MTQVLLVGDEAQKQIVWPYIIAAIGAETIYGQPRSRRRFIEKPRRKTEHDALALTLAEEKRERKKLKRLSNKP